MTIYLYKWWDTPNLTLKRGRTSIKVYVLIYFFVKHLQHLRVTKIYGMLRALGKKKRLSSSCWSEIFKISTNRKVFGSLRCHMWQNKGFRLSHDVISPKMSFLLNEVSCSRLKGQAFILGCVSGYMCYWVYLCRFLAFGN